MKRRERYIATQVVICFYIIEECGFKLAGKNPIEVSVLSFSGTIKDWQGIKQFRQVLLRGNLSLVGFCRMPWKIEEVKKNIRFWSSMLLKILGGLLTCSLVFGDHTLFYFILRNRTKNVLLFPLQYFWFFNPTEMFPFQPTHPHSIPQACSCLQGIQEEEHRKTTWLADLTLSSLKYHIHLLMKQTGTWWSFFFHKLYGFIYLKCLA